MRSLRERIVQLNWKDQSSRLLAARKVQVQVNCFFSLQILVIRPYHLFVAQDDDTGDEMDASPSLTGKNASELSGNRVRLTTYHVAHELF
jgi:hypothetical protein